MDHICKENDTLNRLGENKIYFEPHRAGGWHMSVDDGCCHTEISYCPFCGKKLTLGDE